MGPAGLSVASPPPAAKSVQITFGLDNGRGPGSVDVIVGLCNQERHKKLKRTILVTAFSDAKYSYDQVPDKLREPLAQVRELVRDGFYTNGADGALCRCFSVANKMLSSCCMATKSRVRQFLA